MIRIGDILEKVEAYNPGADTATIEKAYVWTARAGKGRPRRLGEPYLVHLLEVANTLTALRMDVSSVCAGLLHESVEGGGATLEEIEEHFGPEIAKLLERFLRVHRISYGASRAEQAENFRRMILALAEDFRIILLELADRLHHMKVLDREPEEKRQEMARETQEVYAPIANRLGIGWMKGELEDLAFHVRMPEAYGELVRGVNRVIREREAVIQRARREIEEKLDEAGIDAKLTGRTKHYHSIHLKMQRQGIDLDQVYDLVALRVVVQTVPECYQVLGVLHSLWKPVQGRFKDYVPHPKANGYQSIHTTLVLPEGDRVEVQIRTEEMNRVAENGVAAHWRYKEGRAVPDGAAGPFVELRKSLDWMREIRDPGDLMDAFKMDLFPDEVHVFTPKGDVKVLPRGSTLVDFAFAVHSEVGQHCAQARVNGRLVPLRTELADGDMVEILTRAGATPHKDWLKFVRSSKARTRIKQWIHKESMERSIELGRRLLEKELRRRKLGPAKILKPEKLKEAALAMSLREGNDLLGAVGYGTIPVQRAIAQLVPAEVLEEKGERRAGGESKLARFLRSVTGRPKDVIRVRGIQDVLVRFGRCCNPIPGDPIVGFITRGRGITVHTGDCPRGQEAEPARRIEVEWDEGVALTRPIGIRVTCRDATRVLSQVAKIVAGENATIAGADVQAGGDGLYRCRFEVGVENLDHLRTILKGIGRLKGVIETARERERS